MMSRYASPNTARALKIVGLVLILSFVIDFFILLFPFRPTDATWKIGIATALVDRGIVPMVGLALLLAGYWMNSVEEGDSRASIDIRVPAFIFSSVLGFIFLLTVIFHGLNVTQQRTEALERSSQLAAQEERQLSGQLSQFQAQLATPQAKAELERFKAQAQELLKNEAEYNKALQNPNLPADRKELLKKFKTDPKALDEFIAQQTNPEALGNQGLASIRRRREQRDNDIQQDAWKSALRVCTSSLLLALGYIIIGWTGLRGMGMGQRSSRQASVR